MDDGLAALIGQLVPLAVTVAFTTVPIIATLVVLLSSPTSARGWAIAGGYAFGLALVVAVATLGLLRIGLPTLNWPFVPVGEVVAGAALLVVGTMRIVRRRRHPTHPTNRHDFTARLRKLSPVGALVLGFSFALHPENLVLSAAASTRIADAHLGPLAVVGVIALFVVIGVSTVVVPTFVYAVGATRVRPALERLQAWILTNSQAIMWVLLMLVGAVLLVIGVIQLLQQA